MKTIVAMPQIQVTCTVKQGADVLGYVAIDSFVNGRSQGGLRLLPDISEAEVCGLARAMTLKYGFLGLPQGGAKAGVLGDPEAPPTERRQRLAAFARAIAPLLRAGIYIPGTDMGTDNTDIADMLKAAGVRVKSRQLRGNQSGYYTALTVFTGVCQAARYRGLPLAGCRVAIEGFGKVGGPLAELLAGAGARVVAISTSHGAIYDPRGLDVPRLRSLAMEAGSRAVDRYEGSERLDRAALLELPVDVLCPCARHHSLHSGNVARVVAHIVCPGANNPITPDAEQMLFERGVLCLPDFVTNSGGVLGGTMEFASIGPARIADFIEQHIGRRISWLLDEAARRQVPLRAIAEQVAVQRFAQVQHDADHRTPRGRVFEAGLELYRRGWVPARLVAPLALRYFSKSLA